MGKRKQMNEEAEQVIDANRNLNTSMKKIGKNQILAIVVIFLLILFLNSTTFNNGSSKVTLKDTTTIVSIENVLLQTYDTLEYPTIIRERIKEQLICEVKMYMTTIAPTTEVSPKLLVELCLKYDLDLALALAQGRIESQYGTKGMATKSNSVFNVGTWDSQKVLYKYKSPNESIEPYVKLMKEDYLAKKTLSQLLQNGGFVNHNGHRYAAAANYESTIRMMVMDIGITTPIKAYQEIIGMTNNEIPVFFNYVKTNDDFLAQK